MTRLLCFALLALGLSACAGDPEPAPAPPPPPAPEASVSGGDALLDLAELNGSLGMFTRAVEVAGLGDELSAEGPFTVFAPSDAAFAAAGGDALFDDPEALATRLRGLIIPTRMLAVDVFAPIEIETLSGAVVEVDAPAEGQVVVRSSGQTATVTAADLDASNGVIHLIDTFL